MDADTEPVPSDSETESESSSSSPLGPRKLQNNFQVTSDEEEKERVEEQDQSYKADGENLHPFGVRILWRRLSLRRYNHVLTRRNRRRGRGRPLLLQKEAQNEGRGLTGAGLYNLGNTCFLNSILQCLTHTVPLADKLLCCGHSIYCPRDDKGEFCSLCALISHVQWSLKRTGYAIAPASFVENLSHISSDFMRGHQEDAHEFLHCLLNKLDECYLDSEPDGDNLIKNIFGGRTRSQLRCCDCGHTSDTFESLFDLSLEIDGDKTLTLVDALESFTSVEKIDDPDCRFPCEGCRSRVSVEKQFKLVGDKLPQVLVMSLKRFHIGFSGLSKIEKFVEYPLQLDMRRFIDSPKDGEQYMYELYAVVVHAGTTGQGHYYSIVRSGLSTWHMISDDTVIAFGEESVLNREAYVLFYVKLASSPPFSSLLREFVWRSGENYGGV